MPTKRQIAVIMFTDMVGYTAMMAKDEVFALSLLRKNKDIHQHQLSRFNGKLLKEIGDGMLVSFQTITDAVYCASKLLEETKILGEFNLRIGIHLGEVVLEGGDLFGDGVNIASRIERIADSGQLLVSETIYSNLVNKSGIEASFLGEHTLKNVDQPIKIYAITVKSVPDEYINESKSYSKSQKLPKSLTYTVVAMAILLLGYFFGFRQQIDSTVTLEKKGIAVLPFIDMSQARDQGYLGDGIAEEILNILSKNENLKVISRTSSFQFKGEKIDAREVGLKLAVGYIVEGSVRKSGDKIRITAQLINAKDGSHIWSDNWDRVFTDLFRVQDDIAGSISGQLQTSLGLEEIQNERGTNNIEAYEYLLKGSYIHFTEVLPKNSIKLYKVAERMFLEAIRLDANYADAYAELANLYDTGIDLFPEDSTMKTKSQSQVNMAFELNPNSARVNIAKGDILDRNREYHESFKHFVKAVKIDPKTSSWAYAQIGSKLELVGIFDQAVEVFNRALELNPLDNDLLRRRGYAYQFMGRMNDAEDDFKQLEWLGENMHFRLCRLYCLKREIDLAEEYFEKFLETNPDEEDIDYLKAFILAAKKDPKALQFLRSQEILLLLEKYDEWFDYMKDFFSKNPRRSYYYHLTVRPDDNMNLDKAFFDLYGPLRSHPRYLSLLEDQRLRNEENIELFSLRGSKLLD